MNADQNNWKKHHFRSLFSKRQLIGQFLINLSMFAATFTLLARLFKIQIISIPSIMMYSISNVICWSVIAVVVENITRRLNFQKPVKAILDATDKVCEGDLSVTIPENTDSEHQNEFDLIIHNFNLMMEELQSMETLRTDFISNVSHELKTPISAISNYTKLMQSRSITEEERMEYAAQCEKSCRELSGLITNILKLSRLENQKIKPVYKKFDVSERLTQCVLSFEDKWEEKNIELDADIDERIMVNSDEDLLGIVFNNLLSNAMKFTPENGCVKVALHKKDDRVVVSVSDNGIGMDEKTKQHIFEKFYQGDTSHATKGNGLGLALVSRIISILQCEINVESEPGKGSTFTVIIPMNG